MRVAARISSAVRGESGCGAAAAVWSAIKRGMKEYGRMRRMTMGALGSMVSHEESPQTAC